MPDDFLQYLRSKYPPPSAASKADVTLSLKAMQRRPEPKSTVQDLGYLQGLEDTIRPADRYYNTPLQELGDVKSIKFLDEFAKHPMVEIPSAVAGGIGMARGAFNALRAMRSSSAAANRAAKVAEIASRLKSAPIADPKTHSLVAAGPPPEADAILDAMSAELQAARAPVVSPVSSMQQMRQNVIARITNPRSPIERLSSLWTEEQRALQDQVFGFNPSDPHLVDKLNLVTARKYIGREGAASTGLAIEELRAVLGRELTNLIVQSRMTQVPSSFATQGVYTSTLPVQRVAGFLRTTGRDLRIHPRYLEAVDRMAADPRLNWIRDAAEGSFTHPGNEAQFNALQRISQYWQREPYTENSAADILQRLERIIGSREGLPPAQRAQSSATRFSRTGEMFMPSYQTHTFGDQATQSASILLRGTSVPAQINPISPTTRLSNLVPVNLGLQHNLSTANEINLLQDLPQNYWDFLEQWISSKQVGRNLGYRWSFEPYEHGVRVFFTGRNPKTGIVYPAPIKTGYLSFNKVTGGWEPHARQRLLPPEAIGPQADKAEGFMMRSAFPVSEPAAAPPASFVPQNLPNSPNPEMARQIASWSFQGLPGEHPSKAELFYEGLNEASKATVGGRMHSGATGLTEEGSLALWNKYANRGKAWEAMPGYWQPADVGRAPNSFDRTRRAYRSFFGMYGLVPPATGLGLLGMTAAETPPIIVER